MIANNERFGFRFFIQFLLSSRSPCSIPLPKPASEFLKIATTIKKSNPKSPVIKPIVGFSDKMEVERLVGFNYHTSPSTIRMSSFFYSNQWTAVGEKGQVKREENKK